MVESISFRWGIPELDHGNVIIPEPIYRYHGQLGVTGNLFVLMVQLAAFKYESAGSIACPSFQTLADRMALSRRRVIELVNELEQAGWLIVTRKGQCRNEYDMRPFAQACWNLYKEAASAESRTSIPAVGSAENFTTTSAESRTPLVRNPAPEEQEEKNKKTKNNKPLSDDADKGGQPEQPAAEKPAIFSKGEVYSVAFEEVWAVYREGTKRGSKFDAAKAFNATIRERMNGDSPEVSAGILLKCAQNYVEDMRLRGKLGTEYVMHCSTFLGPGARWREYEEWTPASVPPARAVGAGQLARGRTVEEYAHVVRKVGE